jgi:NitT/TauT family transport system substrate-binding protein
MGCCEATNPRLLGVVSGGRRRPSSDDTFDLRCDRRTAVKGLLAAAGAFAAGACVQRAQDGRARVRLAFCGQLLCVVPYEVARARGHFAAEGLDVELVYTRGGNAAMQALVGGAVDYAGTSFDVALQAAANGAAVRRFASTGRLPLFALAVAPGRRDTIVTVEQLEGASVAVSGLGNADHALLLYLLDRAGVDGRGVRVAAIGTNVLEALRIGQVDAAMVQEPALTLVVRAGGRELVNFMDLEQASRHLGGASEMRRLSSALARGLEDTRVVPPREIVAALPGALVAGLDPTELERIIDRYRLSLYPERVTIQVDAARRVARAQEVAGLLDAGRVDLAALLDVAALET